MSVSYFIKRGGTVKGPFDRAELKTLIQGKKLKKTDGISKSADGPWNQVGSSVKQMFGSAKTPAQPTIPTIKAWKVKRGLLGKIQVNFKCPGCRNELKSDESEVLQQDYCSACGAGFMLGQQVADEIAVVRERVAAEKAAKQLESQQRMQEIQQHKQQRRREEQERRQKKKERQRKQQAELLPRAQPITVVPSNPHQQATDQYQQVPVLHQTTPVAYQQAPAPQHNIVVNVTHDRRKSRLVAFLLAFFFGPLGMLYSTVPGAIVIFLVNLLLFVPSAFLIFLITWPLGCVWAVAACD